MNKPVRVLILDDDESFRTVLRYNLTQAGYEVMGAEDGHEGLRLLERHPFSVLISDIKMPGMDGMEVLRHAREKRPDLIVIMVTAYGSIEMAVEAMRDGAHDYITKPLNRDELLLTLQRALERKHLEQENLRLREELGERFHVDRIVGDSAPMRQLLESVRKVAATDATVLLTGETGTGKELVARAIHYNSPRRDRPLVVVNCAAIPKDLLESELFGHVKGAFTGAARERDGTFAAADRGTLFLDEIGTLAYGLQAKLLRVLQDRQVTKVGGEKPFTVDVRIVAATNADLRSAVEEGTFREDLYYRLNVVPLEIPPLRERKEDIPSLAEHFLGELSPGKPLAAHPQVLKALTAYPWPGNVRELRNVIERMVIFQSGDTLLPETLPREILGSPSNAPGGGGNPIDLPPEGASLEEMEKAIVVRALEINGWNKSRTAKFLRVPRHILLYRMEKYGLKPDPGGDDSEHAE